VLTVVSDVIEADRVSGSHLKAAREANQGEVTRDLECT